VYCGRSVYTDWFYNSNLTKGFYQPIEHKMNPYAKHMGRYGIFLIFFLGGLSLMIGAANKVTVIYYFQASRNIE